MSIVREVRPVLHAALDDHIAELNLLAGSDLHLKKLVTAFFKVNCRHDDQVDRLSKLNQIAFGEVFHFLQELSTDRKLTF